jgi:hypothetical protein
MSELHDGMEARERLPRARRRGSLMSCDYGDAIPSALATQGGHLFIGRGGFSLHYKNVWLSGAHTASSDAV